MRYSFVRRRELPLGIDIGASKLRMAYARDYPTGASVEAVTSRNREEGCDGDWLSAMLEEMREDLGARTRSCSMALDSEEATVDLLSLPNLSYRDRTAAAHIEARRRYQSLEDRRVRLFSTERPGHFLLVTAPLASIALRKNVASKAGLHLVALSVDGLAWNRFVPKEVKVVDIGVESTRLHTNESGVPTVAHFPVGGNAVTREMAGALGIDERSAEKRKRILGLSGAGDRLVTILAEWICERFENGEGSAPAGLMLVGNGSRLPELRRMLADRLAHRTWRTACAQLERSRYPEDIRRAAFSDWALSIALTSNAASGV